MALWEPASAYRLNPETLETIGIKTWRPDLAGMPFSAHPKVEPDGVMWNFGVNPVDNLLLYHISPDGALLRATTLHIPNLSVMHDFAVTQRHLVFLLTPLVVMVRAWRPENPSLKAASGIPIWACER